MHKGPVFLGIDYGTTRVKATVLSPLGEVLGGSSLPWTLAGCDRRFLSDWLKILPRAIDGALTQHGARRRDVAAMCITTMSPCVVLLGSPLAGVSSPMVLYDEVIHARKTGGVGRIDETVRVLRGLTPGTTRRRPMLLTANAWLAWQLTGAIAIDVCSVSELVGWNDGHDIVGAQLPERRCRPEAVVGSLQGNWPATLGLPCGLPVAAGGSDTLGLAFAAGLGPGDHLAYLGTFFSLLESCGDFSAGGQPVYDEIPFRWRISIEGGAFVERLSAAFFPLAGDRSEQIRVLLDLARKAAEEDTECRCRIAPRKWSPGLPVQTLPAVIRDRPMGHNEPAALALAPLRSFALAMGAHCRGRDCGTEIEVAGGLSREAWILQYLGRVAGLRCVARLRITGAEGAARLALRAYHELE